MKLKKHWITILWWTRVLNHNKNFWEATWPAFALVFLCLILPCCFKLSFFCIPNSYTIQLLLLMDHTYILFWKKHTNSTLWRISEFYLCFPCKKKSSRTKCVCYLILLLDTEFQVNQFNNKDCSQHSPSPLFESVFYE